MIKKQTDTKRHVFVTFLMSDLISWSVGSLLYTNQKRQPQLTAFSLLRFQLIVLSSSLRQLPCDLKQLLIVHSASCDQDDRCADDKDAADNVEQSRADAAG